MNTILFAGGGTLGPVTPLIAIWRQMKRLQPDIQAVWVGTPTGPERAVVEAEGIPFFTLPIAKIPRFFGLELLQFPLRYWKASQAAKALLEKQKPRLIVSVGGYMGTPLIRAAAKKGIPCAIHQLDAKPGLSNRAVARLCASVTTSFAYSKPIFFGVRAKQVSTPCRFSDAYKPVSPNKRLRLFFIGGGTGAQGLNDLVAKTKKELSASFDIVHLAGSGKGKNLKEQGYSQQEFFTEKQMQDAYQSSDIVIARAGIGTISECAALHKATILVPMPHSHQEDNVRILGDAVLSVHQEKAEASQELVRAIARFTNASVRAAYGERLHQQFPTDNGESLARIWLRFI